MPAKPQSIRHALTCIALIAISASAAARDISFDPGRLLPPRPNPERRTGEVVLQALSLTGLRYKYGGTSVASGMDCSALVQHVFRSAWQHELPRTAEEISRAGERITMRELQAGDLVFFNTGNRPFSHVGIYLGDEKFVHSPSPGGAVRVENMGLDYWKRRYDGARRIIAANSDVD